MDEDRKPLPIDSSGNSARIKHIAFDEADAPMMAFMLMLMTTRAMMSGAPNAAARYAFYREQFLAIAPPAYKLLRHETDLCEIAVAMASSLTWSVEHKTPTYSWQGDTHAIIRVGDQKWQSKNPASPADRNAIIDMLRQIAPMTCQQVQTA